MNPEGEVEKIIRPPPPLSKKKEIPQFCPHHGYRGLQRRKSMKFGAFFLALVLIFAFSCTVKAANLFSDDFENGLSDDWVVFHLDGAPVWEVVEEDGNSVLKVDSSGAGWTGATFDGVAGLDGNAEIWAICRFRVEGSMTVVVNSVC